MRVQSKAPLISVCLPVYNTEVYLERSLRSVITQDFSSFEVIIVSDNSPGRDKEGRTTKKIVKAIQKECKAYRKEKSLSEIKIKYIEHSVNRGILEVRRTLIQEASGTFIFFLDSDDEILAGTLKTLYSVAVGESSLDGPLENPLYDIVHTPFIPGSYDNDGNFIPSSSNKCGAIYYGSLCKEELLTPWLEAKISGNVCGKLILRSLFEKAFQNIPYTECNMGDDIVIFFFIAQYARNYIGISQAFYRYQITSGMSSHKKIDSLDRWRLICSSSSVFTIISQWIKENPSAISFENINAIRTLTASYLLQHLYQLEEAVIPELKASARQMLCEYWGESFVERMEKEKRTGR